MSKTLAVAAIKNGTVIDHIPVGQALRIIQLLNLVQNKHKVTVGLNLPSKQLRCKDLIKIENRILSDAEANEVTIFAPDATINIIENFEVSKKITTSLPATIVGVFVCPNPVCITRAEAVASYFYVEQHARYMKLTCKYCERQFDRDQVKDLCC